MSRIDGQTAKVLRDALRASFNVRAFDRMLSDQLNVDRQDLSLADSYVDILFDVIDDFNRKFVIEQLVNAALLENSTSAPLQEFRRTYLQQGAQLPDTLPTYDALQRAVSQLAFIDPLPWRSRMAEMENRVCRVEMPDSSTGTGFLLAPDLVITNYHVVRPLVDKPADQQALINVRFDYTLLADGLSTDAGTPFAVAKIEASSPFSEMDKERDPAHDAESDHLDFALLRIAGAPGKGPVGGAKNKSSDPTPRGWIEQPAAAPELKEGTPLLILQHPEGKPLKLAFDTQGVLLENAAKTRVRYRVNTEPGSSGSPCFDVKWNLAALHHAGDPNFQELALYNQGIPFPAILAYLEQNNPALKAELMQKNPPAGQ